MKDLYVHRGAVAYALGKLPANTGMLAKFNKMLSDCVAVAVALNPVAVATDRVQSDHCTLEDAMRIYDEMMTQLIEFANAPFHRRSAFDDTFKAVAAKAQQVAKARDIKNLTNGFRNVICFVDKTTPSETRLQLLPEVSATFAAYCNEFSLGCEHTDAELNSVVQGGAYEQYPRLKMLVNLCSRVLVTEASVERSFHQMSKVARSERCKLQADTIDILLFTCFNKDRWREYEMGILAINRTPRRPPQGKVRVFDPNTLWNVILNFREPDETEGVGTPQRGSKAT